MAVYDSDSGKLVVRVVYDGPGRAGKTTNLEQMCSIFSRQRRSDLFSGEALAGRTLFLDWLQLDGGLVAGYELRCHLISVPGQHVLNRRRQLLLGDTDAVVFVLDSTESGVKDALPLWHTLQQWVTGAGANVAVVVQANKQDLPGALHPDTVRSRLKVHPDIPIVAARAAIGRGIQDTVVLAIRATATRLERLLAVHGIESMPGHYETGPELVRRMEQMERGSSVLPVGMLWDISNAAKGLEEQPRRDKGHSSQSATGGTTQPSLFVDDAGSHPGEPTEGRTQDSLAIVTVTRVGSVNSRAAAAGVGRYRLRSTAPAVGTVQGTLAECGCDTQTHGPETKPSGLKALHLRPTLPRRDLVDERVWPTKEGAKLLRRLPLSGRSASPLLCREGHCAEGDHSFEMSLWYLRTREVLCFPTLEQAQTKLRQLADWKGQLGSLRAPGTVLAIQEDTQGFWLWTIFLSMPTLSSQLERAQDRRSPDVLGELLEAYARMVVRSLRLSLDSNLRLDLSPNWYGYTCRRVFYLKDAVDRACGSPKAAFSLLSRFDEYSDFPEALERYLGTIMRGIQLHLSAAQRLELHLMASVKAYNPTTGAGMLAKDSLLRVLGLDL